MKTYQGQTRKSATEYSTCAFTALLMLGCITGTTLAALFIHHIENHSYGATYGGEQ